MTFERGEQNMPGRTKPDMIAPGRPRIAHHTYQEQLLLSIEQQLIRMNDTLGKILDASIRIG